MDALSLFGALVAASITTAPLPDDAMRWQKLIVEASRRFAIPVPWIARVIAAESGGRTTLAGVPIRSRAGAIGPMQLMPATWADMRDAYRLGYDPDDPHDNILAGTAYLRLMYDRFGYPGLFAAYNAGPARYAAALATGGRLPDETLAYLAHVTGEAATLPPARSLATMQRLFVVRHERPGEDTPEADRPVLPSLFAVRSVTP